MLVKKKRNMKQKENLNVKPNKMPDKNKHQYKIFKKKSITFYSKVKPIISISFIDLNFSCCGRDGSSGLNLVLSSMIQLSEVWMRIQFSDAKRWCAFLVLQVDLSVFRINHTPPNQSRSVPIYRLCYLSISFSNEQRLNLIASSTIYLPSWLGL